MTTRVYHAPAQVYAAVREWLDAARAGRIDPAASVLDIATAGPGLGALPPRRRIRGPELVPPSTGDIRTPGVPGIPPSGTGGSGGSGLPGGSGGAGGSGAGGTSGAIGSWGGFGGEPGGLYPGGGDGGGVTNNYIDDPDLIGHGGLVEQLTAPPPLSDHFFADSFQGFWSQEVGTWYVVNQQALCDTADGYLVTGRADWADVRLSAAMGTEGPNGAACGVVGRALFTAGALYSGYVVIVNSILLDITLYRYDAGVPTVMSNTSIVSWVPGDTLDVDLDGSTITASINGSPWLVVVDSTYASGRAGLANLELGGFGGAGNAFASFAATAI